LDVAIWLRVTASILHPWITDQPVEVGGIYKYPKLIRVRVRLLIV